VVEGKGRLREVVQGEGCGGLICQEGEIKGSALVVEAVPGGPCVIICNMHECFGHGIERGQQT
jgi:hypothetical protein